MVERLDYGPEGSGVFIKFSNDAWRAITKEVLQGRDNPLDQINEILGEAAQEAAQGAGEDEDED